MSVIIICCTGIYVAGSKQNSSVLRNWQPIKLQENKFESVLALTFTVRKIAHSIPNEFHSCKNIWTQKLFNLLNFRYMTLTMYTLCGSRENVIYKNKTIWTNLSMKLNIALSSGKLKKPQNSLQTPSDFISLNNAATANQSLSHQYG